jgi:hypothetical protein
VVTNLRVREFGIRRNVENFTSVFEGKIRIDVWTIRTVDEMIAGDLGDICRHDRKLSW